MLEWLVYILVLGGVFFLFIAAIGVVRMPDLYNRMHATSKAGTLGVGLILVAVAVFYQELSVAARALSTLAFIVLTAPVAAHALGRAAYLSGVKPSQDTYIDELAGHYQANHRLESVETEAKQRRFKQ
ncbi:monovalent cation/H(+) antiporter subunit G [Meiothermus ruber]|jgi:multicomponent Na+:H+ antiporter subunit G|uniref:Monovalent cation/proton antiporter subunit MnhG/PhaG n=1 Tax=Meiothermus ruber (strain ATCC 35948 / DSM 1279 / VKM B-1258 / 21) TaxID=504728 RepID=D3PQ03_MEIRD|nr:monovalent cation/H(+) antiporter subunit G [Meiothermus ruber]GIW39393.1 MAG: Na+/H+ antiporter subunit G [Meiothermus sp.]ADD27629.1 monovalent cation/proton antiporter, MnhG/PhaG subunit [Meiothermus ruber DSM 1279]AGK04094.1 monovalent cation/proton antiporter subunit MnhG/PhaG [Meiothermus ruber DSM 1279]MCL6531308.1 monovalent cation/H(+) antiporter subunit G [Meiothermus ruber]GAO74557.1 monovalent cation/proton antiporter subunit MnhG/PhaG [Meiothermus ruber H328]